MTDNSFGQILQKNDNVSRLKESSSPDNNRDCSNNNDVSPDSMIYKNNNNGHINDSPIEKTLHNLLTETNDHFTKSESFVHHNHQQAHCHNNNNNISTTDINSPDKPIDTVATNKNIPTDFETVIENAIISMDSNHTLINDKKKLNNSFTHNIHNNEEKPFILESMLSEDHNPTISFELDDLDFPDAISNDFSNNNCIPNPNITTTETVSTTKKNNNSHNDNDLKRKIGEIDMDFEEFERLSKSAKINIDNSNEPPFLSPASLSPMSSLSTDNNESKCTEQDHGGNKDVLNKSKEATILHKGVDNNNNVHNNSMDDNLIHKISDDRPKTNNTTQNTSKNYSYGSNRNMLNSTTNSTYDSQLFIPEKLTKEYTMHQVSEMKKRIINTHKLLLNFNFLKDSYAKTCIELKKSLNALRDSEIHRAHLLLENEKLKTRLHKLESSKNEQC